MRSSLLFFLAVAILFGWPPVRLQGQSRSPLGKPLIRSFFPNDYGGESQNWDFIQDSTGILYVANTLGFMEYDGVSWRHFKPDNDGVPLNFVRDEQGTIYTSGTKFFGRLRPDSTGRVVFESLQHLLPAGYSLDFSYNLVHYQGHIFFINRHDIVAWNGSGFGVYPQEEVIDRLFVFENDLYAVSSRNLYRWQANRFVPVSWARQAGLADIRLLHRLHADTLLVVTAGNGIFYLTGENLQRSSSACSQFLQKSLFFTHLALPDGRLALATKRGGVLIVNPDFSAYYHLTAATGLADNDVKRLYLDHNQRLWIGTDHGLSVLDYPLALTWFDDDLGVEGTVEEIRQYRGQIYIGTSSGVFRFRPAPVSQVLSLSAPAARFEYLEGSGLGNMALTEVNGNLLMGSDRGTLIYDGRQIRLFDRQLARKFMADRHNPRVLLEGHRYGCDVLLLEGNRVAQRIPVAGIDDQIRGIAQDTDNSWWLCTLAHGVYRVRFGADWRVKEIRHFSTGHGLPSLRDNLVYRVDDKIIFTTHNGIYRYDSLSGRFVPDATFGRIYADSSRFVYAFYYDNQRNAWLHAFRKKETAVAWRQPDGTYHLERAPFTGISHMQMYEIYREPGGAAWIGGSDGLVRYDPALAPDTARHRFKVRIRQVTANEDSLLFYGHRQDTVCPPVLDYRHRNLRFQVAALYYEDGNQYRYLLEGYDQRWSSWSPEPFKIYTNLNPGDYTFRVQARNSKGVLSAVDAYRFTILPPWYLEWWFLALSSTAGILLFGYVVRFFSRRRLIRRVEELELKEAAHRQRERISRDLHDSVGANLTYIISSLDYLAHQCAHDRELAAKSNELSEFTRTTMQQLRDTIWHISHQQVTLQRFAGRLREMCLRYTELSPATSCNVQLKGNEQVVLPPLAALNLYRGVQEAVNNAFKHAGATQIQITLAHTNGRLRIEVYDNGRGFEVEKVKAEDHYGLNNLQARMQDMGGELSIESVPGSHTRIIMVMELT